MLKELSVAGDINDLLTAERFILNQELFLYTNSAGEHSSIKTALQPLGDADNSLLIVVDAEIY